MRRELEQIRQIENYLLDKMSDVDKANFEIELQNDTGLQRNVSIQRDLVEGIKRLGLRKKIRKTRRRFRLKKGLIKAAIVVVAGGLIASTVYFLLGEQEVDIDNQVQIEQFIEFPENDSLSANPNKYLDQEIFKINVKRDTVVESKDGVTIFVPANAFDTQKDEVDLLLQTAVKSADVIKAGLSTQSNGTDLETGGMFYVDAYTENQRVGLTKNLVAEVPAGEQKNGMRIYDGVKDADGEINWVSPKPIENFLVPVNITSLDFYPPGYEATLDHWGLYGKEFRDSLYFSFAFYDDRFDECDQKLLGMLPERKLTVFERSVLYSDGRPIDRLMTYEEAKRLCQLGLLDDIKSSEVLIGERLFMGNCASCHFPTADMTGPALADSRSNWMRNSTEENFYAYIKNPAEVIKTDRYAEMISYEWRGPIMPPQEVTNEEIDAIFAYVDFCSDVGVEPLINIEDTLGYEISADGTLEVDYAEEVAQAENLCGINPASVQTIWSNAFTRSFFATREFEERMPWIHRSANDEVLMIYSKNIGESLSYCDSIAATITSGEVHDKFVAFYLRNDGSVASTPAYHLYGYYEKKRKALIEAVSATQTNYWDEQENKDDKATEEIVNSEQRSTLNEKEIFEKEFKENWEKTKQDLGISDNAPVVNSSTYTVTVSSLGWKNIDREIQDATTSRESNTVEYEGKTSSISYEEWTATIENNDKYDRVNVYNIPKSFNSYVKLKAKDGKYNYKLNTEIHYQTLVLAWTENSIYFYQDKKTEPGEHVIALKAISLDEFNNNIAHSLAPIANMKSETKFIEEAFKDQKRVNLNNKRKELRKRIEPVIFPCRGVGEYAASHGGDHPSSIPGNEIKDPPGSFPALIER